MNDEEIKSKTEDVALLLDEEIESKLEEETIIRAAGYLSKDHYTIYREKVMNGLQLYGDNFEKSLGQTLYWANLNDSLKILRYWEQICSKVYILYQMYLAKEKTREGN